VDFESVEKAVKMLAKKVFIKKRRQIKFWVFIHCAQKIFTYPFL
jgi:hypothetical protein